LEQTITNALLKFIFEETENIAIFFLYCL